MRILALIVAAVVLAGCESEAEKHARFMADCKTYDFTERQCEGLAIIAKASADAEASAQAAGMASGLAVGIAVGSGSR